MRALDPTFLWRLCKAQYAQNPLSGEGARLYGGRWNPIGTGMVYASQSKSLACLELFVNLNSALLKDDYVEVAVDLPDDLLVLTLDLAKLPTTWKARGSQAAKEVGANWVRSGESVALRVPSAVIDGEWNVLLNPAHPDFKHLTAHAPKPFHFDARMFQR